MTEAAKAPEVGASVRTYSTTGGSLGNSIKSISQCPLAVCFCQSGFVVTSDEL